MAIEENKLLDIDSTETSNTSNIIKVIGVGGAGSNAVNHMYLKRIQHVTYLLCNTDRQHLNGMSVPNKLCMGETTSRGLGAGSDPEVAKQAAIESIEEIQQRLSDNTRMVIVTAGMGGGTGTGAAPVIAQIAKDMGILTVGIVTLPFAFEGPEKIIGALDGLENMQKAVDALLVINNDNLQYVYADLHIDNALEKANDILLVATESITQIITGDDVMNLDFADVRNTLLGGGIAVVSYGFGSGENATSQALNNALESPLLNSARFEDASRILIHLGFPRDNMPLVQAVSEDVRDFTGRIQTDFKMIWGYGYRDDPEGRIKATILASGFNIEQLKSSISKERIERIGKYYKNYSRGGESGNSRPVIFSQEELDDNSFISLIQDTPTLYRLSSTVTDYRQLDTRARTTAVPPSPAIQTAERKTASTAAPRTEPHRKSPRQEPKREWNTTVISFGKETKK